MIERIAGPRVYLDANVFICLLRDAARIRARVSRLRLPDAIHVATARISGCSSFLTNDRRLRELEGIEVVMLSDLATR